MRCMGGLRTLPWTPPLRGRSLIPPPLGEVLFLSKLNEMQRRAWRPPLDSSPSREVAYSSPTWGRLFLFHLLVLFLDPLGVAGDVFDADFIQGAIPGFGVNFVTADAERNLAV